MTTQSILLSLCLAIICSVVCSRGQDKLIVFRSEVLTPAQYMKEMTDNNWNVDACATEMIERLAAKEVFTGHEGAQVTLEIVTARELGFSKSAAYDRICRKAASRNLLLCNPVDAVEFCKACDRYSITGQSLIIAINPTKCKDGKEYVLLCKCRDSTRRVLIGWQLRPNAAHNKFLPSGSFVFKKKAG